MRVLTLFLSSIPQHPELQPNPLHPGPCLRWAQVTTSAVSNKLHPRVPQWIQYSALRFASYSSELNQSLIITLLSGRVPRLTPRHKMSHSHPIMCCFRRLKEIKVTISHLLLNAAFVSACCGCSCPVPRSILSPCAPSLLAQCCVWWIDLQPLFLSVIHLLVHPLSRKATRTHSWCACAYCWPSSHISSKMRTRQLLIHFPIRRIYFILIL